MKNDTLIRLPGEGCRHYHQGRCLYEEQRNPGYDTGLRCRVIARWSDDLDDFYDRAEAMGVEEDNVTGLWHSRFKTMLPEIRACEEFVMGDHPFRCALLHGLLCLAALPRCGGRCRRYRPPEPETASGAATTNEKL